MSDDREPRNDGGRRNVEFEKEYLLQRLQNTIDYSQFTTKNLYFVNGALLTLVYFASEKSKFESEELVLVWGWVFAVIAVLNMFHCRILRSQGTWYYVIEKTVQERLALSTRSPKKIDVWDEYTKHMNVNTKWTMRGVKAEDKPKYPVQYWSLIPVVILSPNNRIWSNHHLYRSIHQLIVIITLIVSVYSFYIGSTFHAG